MDVLISLMAAVVATGFTGELFISWHRRPRLHAEVWAVAFLAYALGTWALVYGLGFGWSSTSFRLFYFFGAIATISLLGAGSVSLKGEKAGKRALNVAMLWLVFGFFATFLAPFSSALPATGIPEGSEVFGFTFTIEALTLPGPRVFAAVSGAVGTMIVVGLSGISVVRAWRSNRRLAYGNMLIVVGVLVPAFGGSLTAIGESAALALSLMIGIALLWWGYRMATSARSSGSEAGPGPGAEQPEPDAG